MTTIVLSNLPPGITVTPNTFNLSPGLNPGQSTNLTVSITSVSGPTNFCFRLGAVLESPIPQACAVPHCLTLPACCNRVITNTLTLTGSSGGTSTYNFQITIQNIGANPLQYVGFGADQSCVAFIPAPG